MKHPLNDLPPEVAVLATQLSHVSHLREALLRIRQELELRSEVHDRSKLGPDELPGFARINQTARDHAYGSEEYASSLAAEKPTIDHHYAVNSHHPEHFHPNISLMGWLDIIEMVCDWKAAGATYGKTGSLKDSIEVHRKRFDFTKEQWWLIEQVAEFLSR